MVHNHPEMDDVNLVLDRAEASARTVNLQVACPLDQTDPEELLRALKELKYYIRLIRDNPEFKNAQIYKENYARLNATYTAGFDRRIALRYHCPEAYKSAREKIRKEEQAAGIAGETSGPEKLLEAPPSSGSNSNDSEIKFDYNAGFERRANREPPTVLIEDCPEDSDASKTTSQQSLRTRVSEAQGAVGGIEPQLKVDTASEVPKNLYAGDEVGGTKSKRNLNIPSARLPEASVNPEFHARATTELSSQRDHDQVIHTHATNGTLHRTANPRPSTINPTAAIPPRPRIDNNDRSERGGTRNPEPHNTRTRQPSDEDDTSRLETEPEGSEPTTDLPTITITFPRLDDEPLVITRQVQAGEQQTFDWNMVGEQRAEFHVTRRRLDLEEDGVNHHTSTFRTDHRPRTPERQGSGSRGRDGSTDNDEPFLTAREVLNNATRNPRQSTVLGGQQNLRRRPNVAEAFRAYQQAPQSNESVDNRRESNHEPQPDIPYYNYDRLVRGQFSENANSDFRRPSNQGPETVNPHEGPANSRAPNSRSGSLPPPNAYGGRLPRPGRFGVPQDVREPPVNRRDTPRPTHRLPTERSTSRGYTGRRGSIHGRIPPNPNYHRQEETTSNYSTSTNHETANAFVGPFRPTGTRSRGPSFMGQEQVLFGITEAEYMQQNRRRARGDFDHLPRWQRFEDDMYNRGYTPGQGVYYREGDPAFFKYPWPPGWEVCKPEQYAMFYTYQEHQQRLKDQPPFVFNGNVEEYKRWQPLFFEMVHTQDMPVAAKHAALDKYLSKGVKERVLNNLGMTVREYYLAIITLDQQYGQAVRSGSRIGQQLRDFRNFTDNDLDGATLFFNLLQKFLGTGTRDDDPNSQSNLLLVPTLIEKLPRDWRRDYYRWAQKENQYMTPMSLYIFLKPIVESLRWAEEDRLASRSRNERSERNNRNEAKPRSPEKPRRRGYLGNEGASRSLLECIFCKGNHILRRCVKFYELPSLERCRIVKEHSLCRQCLSKKHPVGEVCYLGSRRCDICRAKHHTSVHNPMDSPSGNNRGHHGQEQEEEDDELPEADHQDQEDGVFLGHGLEHEDLDVTPEDHDQQDSIAMKAVMKESNWYGDHNGKEVERKEVALAHTVIRVGNPVSKRYVTVNCLVDSGANHTTVSQRLINRLKLSHIIAPYTVVGWGGHVKQMNAPVVKVEIAGLGGVGKRVTTARGLPSVCGDLKVCDWNKLKLEWPHLKHLSFPTPVGDGQVDVLLGTDNADLTASVRSGDAVLPSHPKAPIARNTKIGWIPMGTVKPWNDMAAARQLQGVEYLWVLQTRPSLKQWWEKRSAMDQREANQRQLMYDQFRLWNVEYAKEEEGLRNTKESKTLNDEQHLAESMVRSSLIQHSHNKRFQVNIPWKIGTVPLPNLQWAVAYYESYESRVGSTSDEIRHYNQIVQEWIDNKFARAVGLPEAEKNRGHYIPGFIVARIDKTTTKFRLVINAAKPYKGIALNDYILQTPDAMNNLFEVLLRFRCGRYVVTADVKNMFLNIEVNPLDCMCLRVIYRTSDGDLGVAEANRHLFGLKSSPFIAMCTIKTHAEKLREKLPEAYRATFDHTIVDDMLCTADNLAQLKQIVNEVTEMFTLCSMKIHKWASNSKRLIQGIPAELRAKQVVIQKIDSENPDLQPVIKTLGMIYEPSRDLFRFSFEFEAPKKWTHRAAASMVASLYDPVGFVSPFVVKGRLLNQRMFAHKIGWDDYVGKRLEDQCKKWLKECEDLTYVEIPRKLSDNTCIDKQRHKVYVFCDASFDAYGACAYLCVNGQSGLLGSRTRVAPLAKKESIGRLELAACVEGVELGFRVTQALKLNIADVKFYTDSTNALLWMKTHKKISVFAASRVCKIKDRTKIEQWKHVQTDVNPADILSRGMTPKKLAESQLWWKGPAFMAEGQDPQQPEIIETLEARQELVEEGRIMMLNSIENIADLEDKIV